MKILKFGGTSVSSKVSLHCMSRILSQLSAFNTPFIVVVSALKGVTDKLSQAASCAARNDVHYQSLYSDIKQIHIDLGLSLYDEYAMVSLQSLLAPLFDQLHNDLNKIAVGKRRLTSKDLDRIMAYGELLSATLITHFLNYNNINVELLDARKLIVTNKKYGNAEVNARITTKRINTYFKNTLRNSVVTGFIASTSDGSTTTLGRGGSDYTATIFGVALNVKNIVKWTDVDGIMTSDPGFTKISYPLSRITFSELSHLSRFSRGVLVHPEAIYPLAKKNISFTIRNTFNREFKGTTISNDGTSSTKIFSIYKHCLLLKISTKSIALNMLVKRLGRKMKLFITTDHTSDWVYYITSKEDLSILSAGLKKSRAISRITGKKIHVVDRHLALVTVTGQSMSIIKEKESMISLLEENEIDVVTSCCLLHAVSFAVKGTDVGKALSILHDRTYSVFSELHEINKENERYLSEAL